MCLKWWFSARGHMYLLQRIFGNILHIFGCHNLGRGGVLLVSSGQRRGMLPNSQQHTWQHPQQSIFWTQISIMLKLRNLGLNKRVSTCILCRKLFTFYMKIYPVKIYLCLLSFKSCPKIIYLIEFWHSAQHNKFLFILKNHYSTFFSIFIKQGNIKQQFK